MGQPIDLGVLTPANLKTALETLTDESTSELSEPNEELVAELQALTVTETNT